jgi:hypothetical protein
MKVVHGFRISVVKEESTSLSIMSSVSQLIHYPMPFDSLKLSDNLLVFLWNLKDVFVNFFLQCHHMSLMEFVVSPAVCGRSVTYFWGWDAHETQLRCPDEVDGDTWSTRMDLKPKFYYTTQTMVTMGIFPFKEKSTWQNRESNPGPHDQ